MVKLLFLLISQMACGYVGHNGSDLFELDLSEEETHLFNESEKQENLNDLNENVLLIDWKSEFEAEHDIEDLNENPFVIDHDYPERILPLNDEGHFDTVNPTNIGSYELYEGDIVLGDFLTPLDDLDILHDPQNDTDGNSWSRKMSIKSMFRWPEVNGVPTFYYRIHRTARKLRKIIHTAMKEWSSKTCIRFHELGLSSNRIVMQQENSIYHVLFVGLRGCWSVLGFQGSNNRKKRQPLSLGKGCKRVRTAIHEIGHALGLVHEQSRADRDDYIKIIFSNVRKSNVHNFKKRQSLITVTYDYSSIMHYGMTYFTKNENPTLVPLDPHMFRFLVNRPTKLTFRDVKVVNTAYNCIAKWENIHNVQCENGGYVGAKGNCVCTPGTSGIHCEHQFGQYYPTPACGGNVTRPTTIQSPNFPKPFPKNSACTWWIIAPKCQRVQLVIKSFKLLRRFRGQCKWDFFELRTEDPINPGIRYCADDLEPGARFLSSGQHLLINFLGKYTYTTGFQAEVTFIPQRSCLTNNKQTNFINDVQTNLINDI